MKTLLLAIIGLLALTISGYSDPISSATLAWDVHPQFDVNQYRLYQGTASRAYTVTNTINGRTNNQAVSTNLQPWKIYYWAVTAVSTNGLESDYSLEVSITNAGTAPINLRIQSAAP